MRNQFVSIIQLVHKEIKLQLTIRCRYICKTSPKLRYIILLPTVATKRYSHLFPIRPLIFGQFLYRTTIFFFLHVHHLRTNNLHYTGPDILANVIVARLKCRVDIVVLCQGSNPTSWCFVQFPFIFSTK